MSGRCERVRVPWGAVAKTAVTCHAWRGAPWSRGERRQNPRHNAIRRAARRFGGGHGAKTRCVTRIGVSHGLIERKRRNAADRLWRWVPVQTIGPGR